MRKILNNIPKYLFYTVTFPFLFLFFAVKNIPLIWK